MSIIWMGGEDIDFYDSVTVNTNTGERRTDYSRCSLNCTGVKGRARSHLFSTGKVTSAWVSGRFTFPSTSTGFREHMRIVGLGDFTSNYYLAVRLGSPDETLLDLIIYDGSDSVLDSSSSGIFGTGQKYKVDIHLSNYGASSVIKVYRDGDEVISFSGDSTISGVTGFDCAIIGGMGNVAIPSPISEVIVADEDTRLMSLKTLAPDAAGDLNEWTGSYTDVDEVSKSDADTIYTLEGSKSFQLGLTGMPTGNFKVKAVMVTSRVADGQGNLDIKAGVKTNSVVHLGNQRGLSAAWQTISEIFTTNPETSSEWSGSEIDALQCAFQSISTTTSTTTTTT